MRLKRLIAWAVYDERIQKGLSQEQLAVRAGVHRCCVSGIENERIHNLDKIEAVLDALGINEFAQLVKGKSPVREAKQAPVDKLPKEEPKPRQNGSRSLRGALETHCKGCIVDGRCLKYAEDVPNCPDFMPKEAE